jgi:hypothetical protein
MVYEGTIVAVMETWPLQLIISSTQGRVHITMREDTEIQTSTGAPGNVQMLRPGRRVRVDGNLIVLLD